MQTIAVLPDSITIYNQAGETYIFPAASLPPGDFARIRAIITNEEKAKNITSEQLLTIAPLEQVS